MSAEHAAPATRPVLALDTSTGTGSVAIGDATGPRAEIVLRVAAGASARLLPAIDHALRLADVERGELGAVVVAAGPGSFTGVRIAAATAKGIVHALGIPLFAYSGLLAAAASAWSAGVEPVYALFDARRRDVYAAGYRFHPTLRTELEPTATSLDDLLPRLAAAGSPVCVGDGALRHREELEAAGARVLPAPLATSRAASLLWLQATAPTLGSVEQPGRWEPDYLRASGAERIAARRAAGA